MFVFRSSLKSAKLRSYVEAAVYIISECIVLRVTTFPYTHTHTAWGTLHAEQNDLCGSCQLFILWKYQAITAIHGSKFSRLRPIQPFFLSRDCWGETRATCTFGGHPSNASVYSSLIHTHPLGIQTLLGRGSLRTF